MINTFFEKLINETPKEIQLFIDKYEEISMRIYQLLEAKGMTQKDLAELMGKRPSEISKWLNDGHNLTLKTITKIEAVLGEDIINIPLKRSFNLLNENSIFSGTTTFTVYKNNNNDKLNFSPLKSIPNKSISKKIA